MDSLESIYTVTNKLQCFFLKQGENLETIEMLRICYESDNNCNFM